MITPEKVKLKCKFNILIYLGSHYLSLSISLKDKSSHSISGCSPISSGASTCKNTLLSKSKLCTYILNSIFESFLTLVSTGLRMTDRNMVKGSKGTIFSRIFLRYQNKILTPSFQRIFADQIGRGVLHGERHFFPIHQEQLKYSWQEFFSGNFFYLMASEV